jgi:hypothetical protein
VGPDYKKYVILGALVGVLLSAAIVIIQDLLDTTIKSEEYLSQVYGKFPLLAVIPGTENSKSGYYKGYKGYKGYYEYTQKSHSSTGKAGAEK